MLVGAVALAGLCGSGLRRLRVASSSRSPRVVGLSSTLIRPALQALLPSLARTPEELIASNGATSTIESLGTLVGPLLAGVLVSFADVGLVFAVGAGMRSSRRRDPRARQGRGPRRPRPPADGRRRARSWSRPGFAAVARAPSARLLVGLIVAQTFVRGCLNVLIVVAAFDLLDGGAARSAT